MSKDYVIIVLEDTDELDDARDDCVIKIEYKHCGKCFTTLGEKLHISSHKSQNDKSNESKIQVG